MPPQENTTASVLAIVGISLGILSISSCIVFLVSMPLAFAGLVVSFIAWCIATEHWQAVVSLIGLLLSIIGLSLPLMVVLGIVLTGDPTAEAWGPLKQTNASAPVTPSSGHVDGQDR